MYIDLRSIIRRSRVIKYSTRMFLHVITTSYSEFVIYEHGREREKVKQLDCIYVTQ